ncbi:hypothetical protein [Persicobacter psychrovividus]|uniref:ABC transporter ATPase n=1 Tax=Persicobacter psychrovividus TaxID=387638 RepID=A0ABN6LFT9_9BACT|nr:hypothetical protein PEPS_24870 [Persicobacter psychrovividus]
MYVPFDQLPASAKLWIYSLDRPLNQEETKQLEEATINFLNQWQAHGKDLKASMKIEENRFLILAVDESQAQASGCSIDASAGFMRKVAEHFQLDPFNRTTLYFEGQENGINMNGLKEEISVGNITENSLLFNTVVQSKGEFEQKWQIPARESWLSRYFK